MIPTVSLACMFTAKATILTSLNPCYTLCLTSTLVNGQVPGASPDGPASGARVPSGDSRPSKARVSESIQTETSGAPGASSARIQTQYTARVVTNSGKTFSLLNISPP